jgi:hypothetical protein
MTYPPPPQAEGDEEEPQPETYAGTMVQGQKVGRGKYTWPDGATYEGEYDDDKRHGKGTMTFANGDVYVGQFVFGVLAGEGLYKYKNGDIYKGLFYKGKRDGNGSYHFAEYRCQFVGTFEAGAFKEGRWIHCDGSYILGAFTNDPATPEVCLPHGAAERYFARAGLKQAGHFDKGLWEAGSLIAA